MHNTDLIITPIPFGRFATNKLINNKITTGADLGFFVRGGGGPTIRENLTSEKVLACLHMHISILIYAIAFTQSFHSK